MISKKIIIIGGGGHARVLIDAILSTGNYDIEGILDGQRRVGEKLLEIPVIGGDELLLTFDLLMRQFRSQDFARRQGATTQEYPSVVLQGGATQHTGKRRLINASLTSQGLINQLKDVCLAIGIGTIKATDKRKMIYERHKRNGFEFPVIIHKGAYVSKAAKQQDGVQVMAGAIINPEAEVGENTIVNTGAIVEHECKVASHCHISLNVVLGGKVTVGECSHIGMGAQILQGVRIGSYVTVGAGAVVTKDVEDGKMVVGMPAKEMNG